MPTIHLAAFPKVSGPFLILADTPRVTVNINTHLIYLDQREIGQLPADCGPLFDAGQDWLAINPPAGYTVTFTDL